MAIFFVCKKLNHDNCVLFIANMYTDKTKHVVYLMPIRTLSTDGKFVYKFGYTSDLYRRIGEHEKTYECVIEEKYVIRIETSDELQSQLTEFLFDEKCRKRNIKHTYKRHKELIQIKDQQHLNEIYNVLANCVNKSSKFIKWLSTMHK